MSQTPLDTGVNGQTVEACPSCNSTAAFTRRVPRSLNSSIPADAANYRCDDCGAEFDEPNVRPAMGGRPLKGIGLFLYECPPDADLDELADLYQRYTDEGAEFP